MRPVEPAAAPGRTTATTMATAVVGTIAMIVAASAYARRKLSNFSGTFFHHVCKVTLLGFTIFSETGFTGGFMPTETQCVSEPFAARAPVLLAITMPKTTMPNC